MSKYLQSRVLNNGGSGIILINDSTADYITPGLKIADLKYLDLASSKILVVIEDHLVQGILDSIKNLEISRVHFEFYNHSRFDDIIRIHPGYCKGKIVLINSLHKLFKGRADKKLSKEKAKMAQKLPRNSIHQSDYIIVLITIPVINSSVIDEATGLINKIHLRDNPNLNKQDLLYCNVSFLYKKPIEQCLLHPNIKSTTLNYTSVIPVQRFTMNSEYSNLYNVIEAETLPKWENKEFTSLYEYFSELKHLLGKVLDPAKLTYIENSLIKNKQIILWMPFNQESYITDHLKHSKTKFTVLNTATNILDKQKILQDYNNKRIDILIIVGAVRNVKIINTQGEFVVVTPHHSVYSYLNGIFDGTPSLKKKLTVTILETRKKHSLLSQVKQFLRYKSIESLDSIINKSVSASNNNIIRSLEQIKKLSIEKNNCF
jgi:hypothetical protein